jgi:hypothetical protein
MSRFCQDVLAFLLPGSRRRARRRACGLVTAWPHIGPGRTAASGTPGRNGEHNESSSRGIHGRCRSCPGGVWTKSAGPARRSWSNGANWPARAGRPRNGRPAGAVGLRCDGLHGAMRGGRGSGDGLVWGRQEPDQLPDGTISQLPRKRRGEQFAHGRVRKISGAVTADACQGEHGADRWRTPRSGPVVYDGRRRGGVSSRFKMPPCFHVYGFRRRPGLPQDPSNLRSLDPAPITRCPPRPRLGNKAGTKCTCATSSQRLVLRRVSNAVSSTSDEFRTCYSCVRHICRGA